jgi:hypothetical protein
LQAVQRRCVGIGLIKEVGDPRRQVALAADAAHAEPRRARKSQAGIVECALTDPHTVLRPEGMQRAGPVVTREREDGAELRPEPLVQLTEHAVRFAVGGKLENKVPAIASRSLEDVQAGEVDRLFAAFADPVDSRRGRRVCRIAELGD